MTKTGVEQSLTTRIACYGVLQCLVNNMGSMYPVFSQTCILFLPLGFSLGNFRKCRPVLRGYTPIRPAAEAILIPEDP